jgi:sulfoquinovose isomerase
VIAEAVGAATAMFQITGERNYQVRYDEWWQWAENHFVDRKAGSWHHELDTAGRPASTVKKGKADIYHAFQATLLPQLPLTASLASAILAAHATNSQSPNPRY